MLRRDSALAILMQAWMERRLGNDEFRQNFYGLTSYLPERYFAGDFSEIEVELDVIAKLSSDCHQYECDPELLAQLREGEEHPEFWLGDQEIADSIIEAYERLIGTYRTERQDPGPSPKPSAPAGGGAPQLLWRALLEGRLSIDEFAAIYVELIHFDAYSYRPSDDPDAVNKAMNALAQLGHYCGRFIFRVSQIDPADPEQNKRRASAEEELRNRVLYTDNLFRSLAAHSNVDL